MTKASTHADDGGRGAAAGALAGASAAPTLPVPLSHQGLLPAIWTLFGMEVSRQCRSRRMLVVLVLFALPVAFAALAHVYNSEALQVDDVELNLVFYFIPHALVPLTALLYAAGMIQDEIEEQTLTYLLIRPVPKWAIYVTKLVATFLVTCVLVGFFTVATDLAVFWGSETLLSEILPSRALKTVALIALSLMAYVSLFACLSLFVKRTLALGVAYIILFEGVIANIDFVARWGTVMFYFRVLCERWLGLNERDWSIDLETAPSAGTCVWILAGASLAATVAAVVLFTVREFRVKTPEGS